MTEEVRRKVSESLKRYISAHGHWSKGKLSWNKGKHFSEGTKRKISLARKGKDLGNTHGFVKGFTPWNKGEKWSEETKRRMSIASRGVHRSPKTEFKKGHNAREKCNFWKGGISKFTRTERMNIMSSWEYKEWRKKVFERDNYTCQMCKQRGGYLEADHIKSFSKFPKLRFEVLNGRTLCKPCHRKITSSQVLLG